MINVIDNFIYMTSIGTENWDVPGLLWSSGFPYFLQFKSEFGNKEFMIWATVSSRSCFCWLYRASPSLVAYNQSDFSIDHLVMSICRVFSCVVGRGCLVWQMGVCHFLGKTLLSLPRFIPYSKAKFVCCSRCFLTSYFCIPVPYNEKDIYFRC